MSEENEKETPEPVEPKSTEARVEIKSECISEDPSVNKDSDTLSLPTHVLDDINEFISNLPQSELSGNPEVAYWAQQLELSTNMLMRGNVFSESIKRENSVWRQKYEPKEGASIGAGRPALAGSDSGSLLTGEAAILKMTAVMGVGNIVQVPLWHSGIWLSLKAPSESEILALNRRIAREKVYLGRVTNGMAFSNTSVYMKHYILNFILAHVYDCNLKDYTPELLRNTILSTDYPLMLWGILNTMYPNGYNLAQSCISNMDKCQHVTHGKVNISKLLWTDNSSLTEKQEQHMQKRNVKITAADAKSYQDESPFNKELKLRVHSQLCIDIAVPTLQQYVDSGIKWVDGIVKMIDGSFAADLRGKERNDYITNQGKSMMLRQYAHWIKRVYIGDSETGNIVEDRDTIEGMCNTLSTQGDVADSIQTHIGHLIDKATISLVAIPTYVCPRCGGSQKDVSAKYPALIPLEVEQIFFTLTNQRLLRTLSRT